ncbi:MAG: ribosome-associated heat shock protein Hsp15 [Planctomycetota bacterium]|jgi:ribosome-associated heat shock protein Hsp15
MSKNKENTSESMRLDKWLWCARFYKTRSLSATALKNGNVKIDGLKAKPARLIRVDDKLEIRRKPYRYEITVLTLAKTRGSATDAALLFYESEESAIERESIASQLKLAAASHTPASRRPDKQQRRKIIRFTRDSA